jgi:universal stress protein F
MYSSILRAVDLDEPSSWENAAPAALALSRCFAARLTLTYVVPGSVLSLQAQWSELGVRQILDSARTRLARLADRCTEGVGETCVTSGSVYGGVLEAAEQCGADLIVLASHRPEMKDYLIGANASRVVRHARCSVMVVRG